MLLPQPPQVVGIAGTYYHAGFKIFFDVVRFMSLCCIWVRVWLNSCCLSWMCRSSCSPPFWSFLLMHPSLIWGGGDLIASFSSGHLVVLGCPRSLTPKPFVWWRRVLSLPCARCPMHLTWVCFGVTVHSFARTMLFWSWWLGCGFSFEGKSSLLAVPSPGSAGSLVWLFFLTYWSCCIKVLIGIFIGFIVNL
jgi:hypothetical protein